jgi:hypothetical protein
MEGKIVANGEEKVFDILDARAEFIKQAINRVFENREKILNTSHIKSPELKIEVSTVLAFCDHRFGLITSPFEVLYVAQNLGYITKELFISFPKAQ